MEYICEHIKKVRAPYNDEDMSLSVMECGYEMDMDLKEMRKILNRKIGKTIRNVKFYPENWGMQRKTIMTFRYKNLQCEICEHFGTQRDYLCLRMKHIK
jgi:hypothetical protein